MTPEHPIVQAYVNAATETLSTMAMLQMTVTSVEPWDATHDSLDCMATMGLCGAAEGLVIVSVEIDTCRKIVAAMLGMGADEVESQLGDGLAEMLNMIAGAAKTQLAGSENHFTLSLPVPVIGSKTALAPRSDVPGALTRVDVEGAPMMLGVWMMGLNES